MFKIIIVDGCKIAEFHGDVKEAIHRANRFIRRKYQV